jgi:putative hemolysin
VSGTVGLILAVVALVASGVCSALHLALRSLVRTRLAELAEETSPAQQRRVGRILADVDGHCVAIGLPRIVSTLLVAVGMLFWIAHPGLDAEGNSVPTAPTPLHVSLAVLVSAVLLWLFAFVVPSSVANHVGEKLLLRLSWLVRAIYLVMRPLDGLSRLVDEIVKRLAKVSAETEAEVLEAELLSVVEEGRAEGQFDEAEQDMIEAVFEFRSTSVEEIMTPRTEVDALQYTDDIDQVKAFVRDGGHSRIPVYRDNLDHIAGVLYAKDLLRWMSTGDASRPFSLQSILRPAVFVPETKTVRELMAELLTEKVHIALVIDEYGGTAGLVTFEDIVEEIFGEIQDEYEDAEEQRPEVVLDESERSATIDARMHVDDANDGLEPIRLEIPEHEDYDTVGGFVTVHLGRIPRAGESFVAGPLAVEVLDAEPTRVVRVRISPAPEAPPPAGEGDVAAAKMGAK